MSNFTYSEVSDLDTGSYILVDDEPCKITQMSRSKPGKHGSAKARISAKGIFDDKRRTVVKRVDERIKQPRIEKKRGQIINVRASKVQVMDQESYETVEISMPKEKTLKEKIEAGKSVEFWEIGGRRKIQSMKE